MYQKVLDRINQINSWFFHESIINFLLL
jgi:hypothetical protein